MGVFTGEESLVHDGAVGARLIQVSTHVCLGGGGAVKLLPSVVDLVYTQVGGDFSPGGGGFARDRTKVVSRGGGSKHNILVSYLFSYDLASVGRGTSQG